MSFFKAFQKEDQSIRNTKLNMTMKSLQLAKYLIIFFKINRFRYQIVKKFKQKRTLKIIDIQSGKTYATNPQLIVQSFQLHFPTSLMGASIFDYFVVCLIAFIFDFISIRQVFFMIALIRIEFEMIRFQHMHKTLVRFDLDQNVLRSKTYVSAMKTFCVLVRV